MNQDDNICRICLKRQDTLFSLFRSRHGSSPYEKLVIKTNLKIELNDSGPSSICSQCLIDLDTTVSFLDKCEQSNQVLTAKIGVSCKCYNNSDEEFSNHKVDCNKLERKTTEIEPLTHDLPTAINVLYSPNDAKEIKLSEELQAQKCPECGSKRRCRHWTPPASFTCQYCDKIFNKKYNFQIHLKRHLGERDWPCPTCGALQLTESLAQRHCRPKVLRQCPVPDCGKTFTNNTNLRTHIRTHSGERPFECHDCGKGFTSKKTLKSHIRIHTGEKPYMCQICGARFMWNHMSAHVSRHCGAGGERARRLACARGGCARRFASAGALRSHARSHAAARSFACALCAATYKYKQSLNHHVRKRHGVKSSHQQGQQKPLPKISPETISNY